MFCGLKKIVLILYTEAYYVFHWKNKSKGFLILHKLGNFILPFSVINLSHTHHMYIEPRQKALCNRTECPLPRQQGLEELRVPRETWAVPAAMSVAPE